MTGTPIDEETFMNARGLLTVFVLTVLDGASAFGADSLLRARREMDLGRFDSALHVLNERLERHPRDVEALKERALAASGLGRYAAAVRDYEAALAEDPKAADVHRDLGLLLAFKMNDARHAMEHLDRYLDQSKDKDGPLEVVRALKSLDERCSKRERQVSEGLIRMARSFESTGKTKVAIRTYERALEIRPACAPCHESLGRLLKDSKHREKARLLGSVDKFSSK
jgi:tetratricopeptide (TPR) repeat protein